MRKEKILIVDDSEMNRAILSEILGDDYEILEAEDGVQGVDLLQKNAEEIDLILLDIVMPNLDGFGVLTAMNDNGWIDDIPVIMVSAEREAAQVERAYSLGVTDFITRPFDSFIVRHRVVNTLLLYAKQKQLIAAVEEQLNEKEKYSSTMLEIFSHIVEARNGESGLHVLHVRTITDFLLRKLKQRTNAYELPEDRIALIGNASALHDIGKISIDEKILNKPGRLTDEEFAIMKTHPSVGAKMLEGVVTAQDDPLVKAAYEICRWHHERYDGRGYPDGLKGDEIPISAQVVALADVYDALTSVRVYKGPFDHETAVRMILNGECGTFNPLLMDCLRDCSAELQARLKESVLGGVNRREIKSFADAVMSAKATAMSEQTLHLLNYERMKNTAFTPMSEEIQFEYNALTHVLAISAWGANKLGTNEIIPDADRDAAIQSIICEDDRGELAARIRAASPDKAEVSFECALNCKGKVRWHRLSLQTLWTKEEPPRWTGLLGKAVDIHETHMEMENLKKQ